MRLKNYSLIPVINIYGNQAVCIAIWRHLILSWRSLFPGNMLKLYDKGHYFIP